MEIKPDIETFAKIKVVGVGGSGGAAVNRMLAAKVRGVEFVAINTDAQALHHNAAPKKIHVGQTVTRGLGAGMDPDLGKKSAEEDSEQIYDALKGTDMVFISCGLGGGTGTGASPVVADIAREIGALTVAVVTKPFSFEGSQRKTIAEQGYDELAGKVDTIITIPNDRIFQVIEKKTTLLAAFETVDDVLRQGVQGISDIITVPGLINVDFADVRAIMRNSGSALMGIGRATGDNRAVDAAKAAIDSPLLEISIDGARGILFTITGGHNLTMNEVSDASRVITASADPNAKIIFGAIIDENLKDEIKVTVVATGFGPGAMKQAARTQEQPLPRGSSYVNISPPPTPSGRSVFHEQVAPRPAMRPTPPPPAPTSNQQHDNAQEGNDDELEIPAFIRKKMM